MKKLLSILMVFTMFMAAGLKAFADDAQEALKFFNSYVAAANSYRKQHSRAMILCPIQVW